jgi:hypothetical protein
MHYERNRSDERRLQSHRRAAQGNLAAPIRRKLSFEKLLQIGGLIV